ncbi:MAG TPA: hypothetical protein VLS89_14035, partial [Candidatus Nanopelagicales bacterium]|nr:hypothetical protein [Candidatus Nanopelagicales bacterium]
AGCGLFSGISPANCDRSAENNPEIPYTEGLVEDGIYMSADWEAHDGEAPPPEAELLYFPGGMRYEIQHQLGETPEWWLAYLSFERYIEPGQGVALAAGNQAEVRDLDEERLVIVNATCSEFWLLVVAGIGDVTPPEIPTGD